jgi:hypothetical protein
MPVPTRPVVRRPATMIQPRLQLEIDGIPVPTSLAEVKEGAKAMMRWIFLVVVTLGGMALLGAVVWLLATKGGAVGAAILMVGGVLLVAAMAVAAVWAIVRAIIDFFRGPVVVVDPGVVVVDPGVVMVDEIGYTDVGYGDDY